MSEESKGIPMMSHMGQDPGPELVTLPKGAQVYPNKGIETRQYGDHLRVDLSEDARDLLASMSEQDLRKFVRAEVHKALDDIAREIRTSVAFQPNVPPGVCWACKKPGLANEMEWRDMHLIHATEQCRDLAASLPPTREHRG